MNPQMLDGICERNGAQPGAVVQHEGLVGIGRESFRRGEGGRVDQEPLSLPVSFPEILLQRRRLAVELAVCSWEIAVRALDDRIEEFDFIFELGVFKDEVVDPVAEFRSKAEERAVGFRLLAGSI
jgi:hypothetical protein